MCPSQSEGRESQTGKGRDDDYLEGDSDSEPEAGDVDEDPEEGGLLNHIESVGGVFSSFLSRATGVGSPASPSGSEAGSVGHGTGPGPGSGTPAHVTQAMEQLKADLVASQEECRSLKEVRGVASATAAG